MVTVFIPDVESTFFNKYTPPDGMKIIYILIILLLSISTSALEINEVMYAPSDGNEWIEIYNPENITINMTNWLLQDNKATDEIVCCSYNKGCQLQLPPFSYALITDQDSTIYKKNSSINYYCVDDNSIGNGLGNTQDSISIFNSETKISFTYNKDIGALNNNKTLERRSDGTIAESLKQFGTPGAENSIFDISTEFESLVISEFMPDPFNEDNAIKPNGEWVELYNLGDSPLDLRGLYFTDQNHDNELYISEDKVLTGSQLVIYPDEFIIIYRNGDTDFSLNNNGYDEIKLYHQDNLIDFTTYSGSTQGMSWSNIEGDWYLTSPSPGFENLFEEVCDWFLILDINNSIFHPENFFFELTVARFLGLEQNITVNGEIVDINGDIVKEYHPWTNSRIVSDMTKSYSPNLKEGLYQVNFWIEELACNEEDPFDNEASRLIAINPNFQKFESSLSIENIYLGSDNKAEWGDQFTSLIKIYKGNETKKSVQLWVEKNGEKVSKTTRFSIEEKFREYPLTLPLQLNPNCNNEENDGDAKLVVEAFGLRTEKEFEIGGVDNDICKDYLSYIKEVEKEQLKGINSLHSIKEIPSKLSLDEEIPLTVKISNPQNFHTYQIWSYLYRGSKCYSCQQYLARDHNKQFVNLKENEEKEIYFNLIPNEGIKEGDYKVKVKIRKDNQKTTNDLSSSIRLEKEQKTNTLELIIPLTSSNELNKTQITFSQDTSSKSKGFIAYESSSEKSKKSIIYFLASVLALSTFILLKKS